MVPHRPVLRGQARLSPVKCLDLALLVDREHDGVCRRINIEADNVAQLGSEVRVIRELRCGCKPCARQMRCTELTLIAAASAMAPAVQCVVSPGASPCVSATIRSTTSRPSGGTRDGRVSLRVLLPQGCWAGNRPQQTSTACCG